MHMGLTQTAKANNISIKAGMYLALACDQQWRHMNEAAQAAMPFKSGSGLVPCLHSL